MLVGELVSLRARCEDDVPVLHAELHEDVPTRTRTITGPWRPIAVDSSVSPFTVDDTNTDCYEFSVVDRSDDSLAGACLLSRIDAHNRNAEIGLALRPAYRGRGFATDVVRVLTHYGFVTLGMHRMIIATLADNLAMRRAAERAGYVREGALREHAWVNGQFVDEVCYGLLADEWSARPVT